MENVSRPLMKSLLTMADVVEARDAYTGGHLWANHRRTQDSPRRRYSIL